MLGPRPSKLASYAVAPRYGSEIPQQDLNTPFPLYANSVKTSCFALEKGGKEHEGEMHFVRGNELNLTGWVFKDHSGQAKCFIEGI